MCIVEGYGKEDRPDWLNCLPHGGQQGLGQHNGHECSDSACECGRNAIGTFPGQRMETVTARHAAAVMLPAGAATHRRRDDTALRQRDEYAGKQKQYYRNGNATPHK